MIYDIRAKDLVVLKDNSEEQREKLLKFVARGEKRGYDVQNYFKSLILNPGDKNLVVESVGRTVKTKTEFAVCTLDSKGPEGSIRFSIQTRLLKLVKRLPRHPVTKIFCDEV